MKMRQKIIGNYFLGCESVQLVARERTGAEFWTVPAVGQTARIKVGMDDANWSEVVGRLIHEVGEFAMTREGVRFNPDHPMPHCQDEYVFHFTHPQFDRIAMNMADFLAAALPDLSAAYKKWSKSK